MTIQEYDSELSYLLTRIEKVRGAMIAWNEGWLEHVEERLDALAMTIRKIRETLTEESG